MTLSSQVPEGWIPARIRLETHIPVVEWRPLGEASFREPFFEDTLRSALSNREVGDRRVSTGLEVLEAVASRYREVPIGGIVHHWSRCGSTLISQMLATDPSNLVLSEPPPVDALLQWVVRVGDSVRARAISAIRAWVRALAGAMPDRFRVFLKLDCWHALQLPLVEEVFSGVPWIFLYRDPLEVLVSHERRCGSQMLPGSIDPTFLKIDLARALAEPLEVYGSRLLAAIGAAALAGLKSGLGRLLNYTQLPEAAAVPLLQWFDLPVTADSLHRMFDATRVHAKDPGKTFAPDSRAKREAASEPLRLAIEEFAGPIYRQLEGARRSGSGLVDPSGEKEVSFPDSFRLPLNFDATRMKQELKGLLGEGFIPHFNSQYYSGDWSALPLRSVDGRPDQIFPDTTRSNCFSDTPHLDRCPYIRSILEQFECPLLSVRLLRLSAGSVVREHRDLNLGYEDGEVRLHIPVVTNPEVEFLLNRERVRMGEGECWYNNLSLPHSVANRGSEDRIHLVIDMQVNEWLTQLLRSGLESPAIEASRKEASHS